jgi:flagellar assembly protein FliH
MALIRHAEAQRIARDAIVLDLGDVQAQAAQLMEQARKRAEAIVSEARAEREKILANVHAQARAEGLAKGTEEGKRAGAEQGRAAALGEWKSKLDQLEKRWTESLASFESQRDRMVTEARADVLRLAMACTEKIVKRCVEIEPGVVADQMDAALSLIARPTEVLIQVHPDDASTAEAALPALMARLRTIRHAEFITDGTLARGSCVVRTRGSGAEAGGGGGGGEIDASIAAQLERVAEMLLPGGEGKA